jgi:outer membrane protein OmpA-like peptidoglycan-associated protein
MWPGLAKAQSPDSPDLMALDRGALRSEVSMRYDAALTLSTDQAIVSASSPRYLWALQAKAQCGIALGFLKSGTKDPVSVSKCDDAFKRMQLVPPPPPPPPPDLVCNVRPYIVFFEWDKSDITPEAAATLDNTASNLQDCGFPQFEVDGYTDRSGSDAYNQALSLRRAEAVRAYLVAHQVPDTGIVIQGFGETNPRVPTADGVRELQNRRVEISVK